MAKARALFVCPEAPYPLIGGGALRAASILEYLAHRYSVDAIVFRQPGAVVELPPGLIDRIMTIELPPHSKTRLARVLRNGARVLRRSPPLIDRFSGFGEQIEGLLRDRPAYELAVVEHFWCAPYYTQIGPRCRRSVLDLHNVESSWHEGCAKVSPWPRSAAHRIFERAAIEFERRWLPCYSTLLATSTADADRLRRLAPTANVAVYPNAIPAVDRPCRREQNVIVFSGTFEYEPNRTAVRHFAQRIWPSLRRLWPDLKWRLVGRGPEAVRAWIAGDPRIECTGPIEDPIAHLATAKIAVAPILSGSGTRLKIVEAWAAGAPVVSTTLGAEGLPARDGESILLADDPERFVSAVSRLLESESERERIGFNGRRVYERELTWNAAWKALDRELEPVVKS